MRFQRLIEFTGDSVLGTKEHRLQAQEDLMRKHAVNRPIITSRDQLVEFIQEQRRDTWWHDDLVYFLDFVNPIRFWRHYFGLVNDGHATNALLSNHRRINYKGEELNIKFPSWIAEHAFKHWHWRAQRIYNDSFVVPEDLEFAVAREDQVYRILETAGIPSFRSRQQVLDGTGIKHVLVTAYRHMDPSVELAYAHDRLGVYSVESLYWKTVERLAQMHELGINWGDARFSNIGTFQEELVVFDFGLKINAEMPKAERDARDLFALACSIRNNARAWPNTLTSPDNILTETLAVYGDKREVKDELVRIYSSPPPKVSDLTKNSYSLMCHDTKHALNLEMREAISHL
ncbi:MAG: hypothetical protein ABIA93_01830 [Candidatus Woesearchaeota archaeon]